jgi:hypothetical protein
MKAKDIWFFAAAGAAWIVSLPPAAATEAVPALGQEKQALRFRP